MIATYEILGSPKVARNGTHQAEPASNGRRESITDLMDVEDTKDRVFIHSLDDEIAAIESDEERPIFIPDIEKHLAKIPRSVLMGDDDKKKMENMQLVLYSVPPSVGVPEDQDIVRKVIMEAKKRGSESQGLTIPEWPKMPDTLQNAKGPSKGVDTNPPAYEHQDDMDMT
jgi:hypothetical protein